jgi:glutathione S-transferase
MPDIRITTLPWAPPAFQGQVRDLAVRWALEEAGLRYEVKLATDAQRSSPAYRQRQPFGKVPLYEEDDLVLFESGAIVLHIAQRPDNQTALLPADPRQQARARAWVIAALNSVDPDITALGDIDHFAAGKDWAKARRPEVVAMVNSRLNDVAAQLTDSRYLAGEFSVADIMMIMVLRALRHTTLVTDIPTLRAYRDRCEARPAFQRALAGQLQTFAQHAPKH